MSPAQNHFDRLNAELREAALIPGADKNEPSEIPQPSEISLSITSMVSNISYFFLTKDPWKIKWTSDSHNQRKIEVRENYFKGLASIA